MNDKLFITKGGSHVHLLEEKENAMNKEIEELEGKVNQASDERGPEAAFSCPPTTPSNSPPGNPPPNPQGKGEEGGPFDLTNLSSEMKSYIMIGGAALLAAGAAPIVIPAAVGAIGFGTGGIVAGSWAASTMSVLGGGATQAGSFVAICQSIGATGTIAASTSNAIGAGVGVTGLLAKLRNKESEEEKDDEEKKDDNPSVKSKL